MSYLNQLTTDACASSNALLEAAVASCTKAQEVEAELRACGNPQAAYAAGRLVAAARSAVEAAQEAVAASRLLKAVV